MDIQSETWPKSLQQFRISMQKQEWINNFWWSATCVVGGKWENVEFLFPTIPIKSFPFPFPWN